MAACRTARCEQKARARVVGVVVTVGRSSQAATAAAGRAGEQCEIAAATAAMRQSSSKGATRRATVWIGCIVGCSRARLLCAARVVPGRFACLPSLLSCRSSLLSSLSSASFHRRHAHQAPVHGQLIKSILANEYTRAVTAAALDIVAPLCHTRTPLISLCPTRHH